MSLPPWAMNADGATRMRRRRRMRSLAWGQFLVMCGWVGTGGAQSVDSNLWGTNGTVMCFARSGQTLYVGGAFSTVGPCSGGGVPLVPGCDTMPVDFPKVAGSVSAVLPDGQGGWFVGGRFSAVGGRPHVNLARVLPDRTVADWSPDPEGSPFQTISAQVSALARAGDTLYVGGIFTNVGGEPRQAVAALEATTGRVLPWDPQLLNTSEGGASVSSIAVMGDTVFVGGAFEQVGGSARANLVALSGRTAEVLDWLPETDRYVNLVRRDGSVLYVAGEFSSIGGHARSGLAAVDAHSGEVLAWNPAVERPPYDDFAYKTMDIVCANGTVYLAGRIATVNGESRTGVAAVDSASGAIRTWNPTVVSDYDYPLIAAMALCGDTLYLGGWFSAVGGQPRMNVAAISTMDTTVLPWSPRTNGTVWALAAATAGTYLGGTFTSMGDWQIRYGLAALDLTTGRLKAWDPNSDGYYVYSMLLSAGQLYVGGYFTEIGGQPRSAVAALDTLTGAASAWNPGANEQVRALAMKDGVLYAGGSFTSIGGQARRYVAALDTATGLALPWNPDPDSDVDRVLLGGNAVYLGGWFSQVGGVERNGLAAVDAATGAVTEWNPSLDPLGTVDDLALLGHNIYVCGQFDAVGGEPRNGLAAVDDSLGQVLSWDPDPDGRVQSLAGAGTTVYAGGQFLTIGGQSRMRLAGLDTTTGDATDWAPGADKTVSALAVIDNTLYAGGIFRSVGGLPATYMAAISLPEPPVEPTYGLALSQSIPNPSAGQALIRYTLPAAATVTLAAYDVQGRRVATWLNHEPQSAGQHEIAVRAAGWRPGMYLYRLEAGGRSATRKMIVVK
jgi:trimeric autotransporter adhesin